MQHRSRRTSARVRRRRFFVVTSLIVLITAGFGVVNLSEGSATPVPAQCSNAMSDPQSSSADSFDEKEMGNAVEEYFSDRRGSGAVAVYDRNSGAAWASSDKPYVSASIMKLAILETLLQQQQSSGRGLTAQDRALAEAMITRSDNAAANALWFKAGGAPAVNGFLDAIGATQTVPAADNKWGLSPTTAADQLCVIRAYAYPNTVLDDRSRSYVNQLLANVNSDQKWGVSAAAGPSAVVNLKNGWLERPDGWAVNSVGHAYGEGRDRAIAVLTQESPNFGYGIASTRGAARATL